MSAEIEELKKKVEVLEKSMIELSNLLVNQSELNLKIYEEYKNLKEQIANK